MKGVNRGVVCWFVLSSVLALSACQDANRTEAVSDKASSSDVVGSHAWMEKVDQKLSVSDGQGHGPDYGSQEWCNVVYFKLHGQHAAEPAPCDQAWMQEVDAALSKR